MVVVSIVLFVIYILVILLLIIRWGQLKESTLNKSEEQIFFSIIIPARNEEENIEDLLKSLDRQQYPPHHFEILIVDDDSTDSTAEVIRRLQDSLSVQIILISQKAPIEGMTPKKSAITKGIQHARGDWIITVDADCTMGEYWLSAANRYVANHDIIMCLGPVLAEGISPDLLTQFQALELASLTGITAVTADAGLPVLANGANMVFKKEAFYEADGYKGNENIPTGDDVFLLEKLNQKFNKQVGYNCRSAFLVTTKETSEFSAFIDQRIRWAGKWRRYNNWYTLFFAFLSFVFNLNMILMLALAIISSLPWLVLVILLAAKAFFEGWFLRNVLNRFNKKFELRPFLLLQIIYPVYIIFIGLISHFVTYTWKERKWKS